MMKTKLSLPILVMLLVSSCTPAPAPSGGDGVQDGDTGTSGSVSAASWKVGDYYKVGLAKGVVVSADEQGEHGIIVSLDEKELQWSTLPSSIITGAMEVSTLDGAVNAESIKNAFPDWNTEFPALAWCSRKNTGALVSWYLPAKEELVSVLSAVAAFPEINSSLAANGGSAIDPAQTYWSSTDAGGQIAYVFRTGHGDADDEEYTYRMEEKTSTQRVRCVRKF